MISSFWHLCAAPPASTRNPASCPRCSSITIPACHRWLSWWSWMIILTPTSTERTLHSSRISRTSPASKETYICTISKGGCIQQCLVLNLIDTLKMILILNCPNMKYFTVFMFMLSCFVSLNTNFSKVNTLRQLNTFLKLSLKNEVLSASFYRTYVMNWNCLPSIKWARVKIMISNPTFWQLIGCCSLMSDHHISELPE